MQILLIGDKGERIIEMFSTLIPNSFDVKQGPNFSREQIWFCIDTEAYEIHWFQCLMLHLIPLVAKELAKQPSITEGYANYLLQQKVLTECHRTHPIDIVYEVWKNPAKYVIDV